MLATFFTSCSEEHVHEFSAWTVSTSATCIAQGTQIRTCESCGFSEYSQIPANGHIEVIDSAVSPTCLEEGKSAGKHCGVCGVVLIEQSSIAAKGHTPVIDPAVAPTCTVDGKTAGSHCKVCNAIIQQATTVEATGHKYNDGEIIKEATCLEEGTKKYTCTVLSCGHTYKDFYSMPTFSATELFNQSIKYVGEIITYDRSGGEIALATGFVISSDGKIVTNYHVIEDAYSATICIDETTYNITHVLAYDSTLDLAILKIDATDMYAANICKKTVNVGETVYAIGSSRGLTNTYSQGIITYADRIVDGVSHVQHDASITHGNSGGPLINVYGEVIGINTWGVSDSQNLNFAVFVGELDNLEFGNPLTLDEFYLQECDNFEKLRNYIMQYGTYNSSSGYYKLRLGTSYSADYASKYDRYAYYYVNDDTITLDFLIDDGEYYVYFEIDNTVDGTYFWKYFDDNGYKMSGTIIASTYSNTSLLGYTYNNVSYTSTRKQIRELASLMVSILCSFIDRDFESIGVTAEDLHFYNY